MAFVFPEDKNDFRAPNGVVYKWDGTKWVVKAFRSTDDFLVTLDDDAPEEPKRGDLWFDTKADELTLYLYTGTEWVPASPPVSLDGIEAQINDALIIQDDLLGRVAAGESKQRQLELALQELSVTKGSVARYTVTETHVGAAIRNGELYVSSPNAADVKAISFAPFDINGQPTRPANTGDIIEFVEATRAVGQVTRYRIVDGGDPQALAVDYISGNNDFSKGENEEVYIYPQNEEGVGKDYVDGLDELNVKKAGSTMTGDLCFNDGSHSIRMLEGTKLRFTGSDSGGNQRTFIDIKNELSSGVEGDEDGYRMRLYHLSDPDNPYHAANKAYVDRWVTAPARLAWKWDGSKDSSSDPGDGKCFYNPGASAGIQGYLRFSFESNNGCHIGDGKFGDTNVTMEYGPCGTVWQWRSDINKWKLIMQFRVKTWRWNWNNHFEFGISSINGRNFSDLVSGIDYHITVGGFF